MLATRIRLLVSAVVLSALAAVASLLGTYRVLVYLFEGGVVTPVVTAATPTPHTPPAPPVLPPASPLP